MKRGNLEQYDVLVIPGGFAYGDYVRAGAILAKEILAKIGPDLRSFLNKGKPVLGICNGFQVLVEAGLLPGLDGPTQFPMAALATNSSARFECRWVHLKHENKGKCIFTRHLARDQVLYMPVAHAEGCFSLPREEKAKLLDRLIENDQVVFRYCDEGGSPANGRYPENPNGSIDDIAGICDSTGLIFGLMPHPERSYYGWQLPDWTSREKLPHYADGRLIFESVLEYLRSKP